jgi:hypothetical protein
MTQVAASAVIIMRMFHPNVAMRLSYLATFILLACVAGRGQEGPPAPRPSSLPAPLNHVYLTVDSATYRALRNSPFMRQQFAASEERTTKSGRITYTGLYFYGRNTYVEFFDAGKDPARQLGDSGIAFGVDRPGGLAEVQQRLASVFPVVSRSVTRNLAGKEIPWFMARARSGPTDPAASVWVMEYDPRFLEQWRPDVAKDAKGVSREQVLRRYIAVLNKPPQRPYLVDIVGIEVAADETVRTWLREMCKALGYRVSTDGRVTALEGPDLTLWLVPKTGNKRGILSLTLRTDGSPDQVEYELGNATLHFSGSDRATWRF